MLLQAGLPLCRVLLVSLLSAVLGFLGMLVGVGVSQQSREVTPWIFSLTAGMFIYVALVDMVRPPLICSVTPRSRCETKASPAAVSLTSLGAVVSRIDSTVPVDFVNGPCATLAALSN